MTKRYTLAEFTAKAQAVHGTKYIYRGLTFDTRLSRVKATCPIHGDFEQATASHLQGQGCKACGREKATLSRRTPDETIKAKILEVQGNRYGYGDITYKNYKAYIEVICSKHGKFTQLVNAQLQGQGCAKCAYEDKGLKFRQEPEEAIKKLQEIHGNRYSYGDITYKDSKAYIDITCKIHGKFNQGVSNHLLGQGCPVCGQEVSLAKRRWNFEEFKLKAAQVHADKYEYVKFDLNSRSVEFNCPEHGSIEMSISRHVSGRGCVKCGNAVKGTNRSYTLEEFVARATELHESKYTYIDLIRDEKALRIIANCKHHGNFTQIAGDHLQGSGCPRCVRTISKVSTELATLTHSWGLATFCEVPIPGTRKRMDIHIPNVNLGIEYNGNHWHSSKYRANNSHKERTDTAADAGIRLVHIFSHEWRLRRPAVEVLLKRLCNVEVHKVAARKCKVVTPSKEVANAFLELNHIQGGARTGEFIGLEYEGKLVAVMVFSFNTSNRNEAADSTKVELTRYASSCTVVGGFSKLMRAWLKLNPVKTVVSYSDNRLFTGKVYELAGFRKIHTTQPDYKYLEPGWDDTLHHKSKYQKKHLVERFGAEACEGKTERQITEENNIYQVYDCGKTRWEFSV